MREGAPEKRTKPSRARNGETGTSEDEDWREIMGKDMVMKVSRSSNIEETDDDGEDGARLGGPRFRAGRMPEMHDAVFIDVVGQRIASSSGEGPGDYILDDSGPFLRADGWLIALGEGDVCNGIEMATRFLSEGDVGTVRCHLKYAYGSSGRRAGKVCLEETGCTDLPPNSEVLFIVAVRSIVPSESERYDSGAFRVERARAKKDLGNEVYVHEWEGEDGGVARSRALRLYGKGSSTMADLVNEVRERRQDIRNKPQDDLDAILEVEAISILVDCLNNLSAVHLRSKSYGLAKEAAASVIEHDRSNLKALIRASRAAMLDPAGTYEESEAAVVAAEEIDKGNKEVRRLRAELTRKKREYKRKEKAMYGKMMGGAKAVAAKEKGSNRNKKVNEDKTAESIYSVSEETLKENSTGEKESGSNRANMPAFANVTLNGRTDDPKSTAVKVEQEENRPLSFISLYLIFSLLSTFAIVYLVIYTDIFSEERSTYTVKETVTLTSEEIEF